LLPQFKYSWLFGLARACLPEPRIRRDGFKAISWTVDAYVGYSKGEWSLVESMDIKKPTIILLYRRTCFDEDDVDDSPSVYTPVNANHRLWTQLSKPNLAIYGEICQRLQIRI
jgi:hypothetical protein